MTKTKSRIHKACHMNAVRVAIARTEKTVNSIGVMTVESVVQFLQPKTTQHA
jgi:hypothetical protein